MRETTLEERMSNQFDSTAIPMDPSAFAEDVFAPADYEDNDYYTETDARYEERPSSKAGGTSSIQATAQQPIDVQGIIALTARLSQLLAEEVEFLADMRIKELQGLQQEKLQLLEALEAHKKMIDSHPELLRHLSDDECLELAQIIEIFQSVMKENHRRLLIAREVNRQVVDSISEAVQESARIGTYGKEGQHEQSSRAVSMSLNQTA